VTCAYLLRRARHSLSGVSRAVRAGDLMRKFAKIEHLSAFRNVREQHIHEGRRPCVVRYPIWFERWKAMHYCCVLCYGGVYFAAAVRPGVLGRLTSTETEAARAATQTIPIVFATHADPRRPRARGEPAAPRRQHHGADSAADRPHRQGAGDLQGGSAAGDADRCPVQSGGALARTLDLLKTETTTFLMEQRKIGKEQAEKLMLANWDCRITQVVDINKGLHCFSPKNVRSQARPEPLPDRENRTYLVTVSRDADLNKAMDTASWGMIELLQQQKGLSRLDAYSLASMVMDCRLAAPMLRRGWFTV
jgi:hypothetical protein